MLGIDNILSSQIIPLFEVTVGVQPRRSLSTLTELKQEVGLPGGGGWPDSEGYSWTLHVDKHRLTIGREADPSEL